MLSGVRSPISSSEAVANSRFLGVIKCDLLGIVDRSMLVKYWKRRKRSVFTRSLPHFDRESWTAAYLDGLDLHFQRGILVGDDYGARVVLQTGKRAHVANSSFECCLYRQSFVCACNDDHHLSCLPAGYQLVSE